jgi:glycosyltransferase involved in cell wall biosynthesis
MTGTGQLRVVVITTIAQTMAAFFEKQLRLLAEEGFEVHAVSSPGEALDHLDVGPDVTKHGLFMERKPSPVQDLRSLLALIRLLRKVRPHVVHAHTPKAGLLGMLAAKIVGIPVRLYTVHGLPLETRTGAKRMVLASAERASAAFSTATYAVSRSVRENCVRFGLSPSDRISVLGDGSCAGVEVGAFQPRLGNPGGLDLRKKHAIPADAPTALFVGRLSRDKGIEVLADAWLVAVEKVPNLHLLIAGEPDHTDPVSEQAMGVLSSDSRIVFLGNVERARMPAVYEASDFAVLPTFREGLPQVALETGAMGIAMVSTRVCGVVDAVVEGETGILVEARNAVALAEAICSMATNHELRRKLGIAAQAYVKRCFSEERVNQLWIAEYRRLVRLSFPELSKQVASQVQG